LSSLLLAIFSVRQYVRMSYCSVSPALTLQSSPRTQQDCSSCCTAAISLTSEYLR